LIGEARPYATATLYAKISGYVKDIRVDKGDRVASGQNLAVIESPEIDRQVDAARADAKSKRDDAKRAFALLGKNAAAYQDWERLEAAAQVSEANLEAITAQKEYELIRAPFAGTIAIRYVDPGALIQSAINAQTTAQPVVSLSQVDRLRVYVYVDQRNAAFVRPGDRAEITDPVRPSVKVSATVTRMSGELDTKTRTLLTEVQVDNRSGTIVPGSFVQTTVWLRTGARVEVPADSLLFRDGKPNVAVVDKANRVQVRPISIVDSDGINLRLSEGINSGEVVILSPEAGMADGIRVDPVTALK
jgi:membrane fusion protein, multidrug efflux system